jgi:hypothetical protein
LQPHAGASFHQLNEGTSRRGIAGALCRSELLFPQVSFWSPNLLPFLEAEFGIFISGNPDKTPPFLFILIIHHFFPVHHYSGFSVKIRID